MITLYTLRENKLKLSLNTQVIFEYLLIEFKNSYSNRTVKAVFKNNGFENAEYFISIYSVLLPNQDVLNGKVYFDIKGTYTAKIYGQNNGTNLLINNAIYIQDEKILIYKNQEVNSNQGEFKDYIFGGDCSADCEVIEENLEALENASLIQDDGDGTKFLADDGTYKDVAAGEIYEEITIETNNQTVFNLVNPSAVPQKARVFVNGIKSDYGTDFMLVDTTLTWLNNKYRLETTDLLEIYYN